MTVAMLLTAACGSGDRAPRGFATATATPTGQATASPTPTEPEPSVELPREWVAVFRVAELDQLDEETEEFMRLVPDNIAISPISCWVGLPERLGRPQEENLPYVAALWAESRKALERAVEKVGRKPILIGEFPAMCGHVVSSLGAP